MMTCPVRICFVSLCVVYVVVVGGCGKRPGVGIWDPDGSVVWPDGSGGEQDLYVLGGPGLSRSPRMALTDVGFAVAWWEEGSVYLQIFDCCVQRM